MVLNGAPWVLKTLSLGNKALPAPLASSAHVSNPKQELGRRFPDVRVNSRNVTWRCFFALNATLSLFTEVYEVMHGDNFEKR